MNKEKKEMLGFIKGLGTKKSRKKDRFDNKIMSLTLQKMEGDFYTFEGNAVYSSDKKVLVYVFNNGENFSIPEGVEIIDTMAFRNKKQLKNVIIPSSVKVIEKNAFRGCDNLDKVVIPEDVEVVKESVFAECNGLKTITFAGTVKKLSHHAFDDSNNLHLIVVPLGKVKKYRKALHLNNDNTDMMVVEMGKVNTMINEDFVENETKLSEGEKYTGVIKKIGEGIEDETTKKVSMRRNTETTKKMRKTTQKKAETSEIPE